METPTAEHRRRILFKNNNKFKILCFENQNSSSGKMNENEIPEFSSRFLIFRKIEQKAINILGNNWSVDDNWKDHYQIHHRSKLYPIKYQCIYEQN